MDLTSSLRTIPHLNARARSRRQGYIFTRSAAIPLFLALLDFDALIQVDAVLAVLGFWYGETS